MGILYKLKRTL